MDLQVTEGIILHSIKYGDFDQILTVFTETEGLIKLFLKNAYSKKMARGALTALFNKAEFLYAKKHSELFPCQEVTVKDTPTRLRNSLPILEAACGISRAIISSQMPLKPSPQLYELFNIYLKYLTKSLAPENIAASFYLKLLRHDGLFGLTPYCSECHIDLENQHIASGLSFCYLHSPEKAITLSPFEAEALFTLAFSRSFSEIEKSALGDVLKGKIYQMFEERIRN